MCWLNGTPKSFLDAFSDSVILAKAEHYRMSTLHFLARPHVVAARGRTICVSSHWIRGALFLCTVCCVLSIPAKLSCAANADTSAESRPSESQVARLVAEAWRPPPVSLDVEYYYTRSPLVRPLEQVRKLVESAYAFSDPGSPYKDNPEARNKEMEAEIQRIAKEQEQPIIIKKRVRKRGYLYREESVKATADKVPGPATEYDYTHVNAGNPRASDYTSFVYRHEAKIATINDKQSSRWKDDQLQFAPALGLGVTIVLKASVGEQQNVAGNADLVPDPKKMRQLVDGTNEAIRVSVESDTYKSQDVDKFTIRSSKSPERVAMVFYCDRDDYSRMYRAEGYHPVTGKLLMVEERDEFLDSGFPQVLRSTKYSPDKAPVSEEFVFTRVTLNPDLPEDTFAFSPPEDYGVVDRRPAGAPIVTQPRVDYASLGVKATPKVPAAVSVPRSQQGTVDSDQETPRAPPRNWPLVILSTLGFVVIAAVLIRRRTPKS